MKVGDYVEVTAFGLKTPIVYVVTSSANIEEDGYKYNLRAIKLGSKKSEHINLFIRPSKLK